MPTRTEEQKRIQREQDNARYANRTPEERKRRALLKARLYYRKKGEMPQEYTSLGRWCIANGYDIEQVMSGEQPL
jgi:hypothetical protein